MRLTAIGVVLGEQQDKEMVDPHQHAHGLLAAPSPQSRRDHLYQTLRSVMSTLLASATTATGPTSAHADDDDMVKDNDGLVRRLCQTKGALVPETAITGAYEQDCMQLPWRDVPLDSRAAQPTVLRLQQGSMSGAGTTGLAVWNSSILLSRLLTQCATNREQWAASFPCMVELGCGPGLASLTAAALGAPRVVATDGNPAVVGLADTNIRANGLTDRVTAQVLSWGWRNVATDANADAVDLVMGSDLTYQSQNWPVLAETMAGLVRPKTGLVMYLTLGHAGFAVQAEVQGFLSVAQQYGLVPVLPGSETALRVQDTYGWPTADLTRLVYEKCLRRNTNQSPTDPDELAIVQSTGGVRVLLLQRKDGLGR